MASTTTVTARLTKDVHQVAAAMQIVQLVRFVQVVNARQLRQVAAAIASVLVAKSVTMASVKRLPQVVGVMQIAQLAKLVRHVLTLVTKKQPNAAAMQIAVVVKSAWVVSAPHLVHAVMERPVNVRVVVLGLVLESKRVQTVHGERARLRVPARKCVAMESTTTVMAS
jgi:hypothetical protein